MKRLRGLRFSDVKVGDTIYHITCDMVRKVVFKSDKEKYILVEGGNFPHVLLEDRLDLWEHREKVYSEIPKSVLTKVWRKSATCNSFFDNLDRVLQDYKESSLP